MRRFRNDLLLIVSASVVLYGLAVLYHIQTRPELGIDCLFTDDAPLAERVGPEIRRIEVASGDVVGPLPRLGDRLLRLGGQGVPTFLHFKRRLAEVSEHQIAGTQAGWVFVESPAQLAEVPPSQPLATVGGDLWTVVEYRSATAVASDEVRHCWLRLVPVPRRAILLSIGWFVLAMLLLSIGALVAWRRPSDPSALLFFALCAVNVVAFLGLFHWSRLVGSQWLTYPFITCAMLLAPLTLHFFLLFPRPSRVVRRQTLVALTALYAVPALGLAAMFVCLLRLDWLHTRQAPWEAVDPWLAALATVIYGYLAVSLALVAIGLVALVDGYFSARTDTQRSQVAWILGAVVLSIPPSIYLLHVATTDRAEFAFGSTTRLMAYLISIAFTLAYAVAIARYKLFEMGRLAGRGGLYVVVSVIATALFCLLVGIGTALVGKYYFRWENALAAGLTSAVLVILLDRVRGRLQRAVDRRFLRQKHQLDHAMQRLSAAVGQMVEPAQLARRVLASAIDAVGADRGLVYLRSRDGEPFLLTARSGLVDGCPRLAADNPLSEVLKSGGLLSSHASLGSFPTAAQLQLRELEGELAFALKRESIVIGLVVLGPKEDELPYTPEDANYLRALSHTAALAVQSAQERRTIETLKGQLEQQLAKAAQQQQRISFLQSELLSREKYLQPSLDADAETNRLPLADDASNAAQGDAGASSPRGPDGARSADDATDARSSRSASSDDTTNSARAGDPRGRAALPRSEAVAPNPAAAAGPRVQAIRGSSPAVRRLLEQIGPIARSPSSVLIRGESGTGKELVARAIHDNSPRRSAPFVAVHCAALSAGLLESELFGHVKGAFTGADRDRVGRFQMAHGGTLLLDEIGDVSLETQIKLLRVIQQRSFEPVGGTRRIEVDVRLLAATHQDLEQLIRRGRFREDLYYRLNVISLTCPPLRERGDDVFELALHFLELYAARAGKTIRRIDEAALDALAACSWPGNVRQLENAIERAVVLAGGDTLELDDLPPEIARLVRAGPMRRTPAAVSPRAVSSSVAAAGGAVSSVAPQSDVTASSVSSGDALSGGALSGAASPGEASAGAVFAGAGRVSPSGSSEGSGVVVLTPRIDSMRRGTRSQRDAVLDESPMQEELEALERQRLEAALAQAAGNKSHAARLLGLPRSTFFSKLRRYNLI